MKLTHLLICLFAMLTCLCVSGGYAQTEKEQPIRFFIRHGIGTTAIGTLGGLKALVVFTPAKPEAIKIDATAEVKTINTGLAIRDNKLRSADYFDAAKHPTISLKVDGAKSIKSGLLAAHISLTIKGVTKNILTQISYSNSQPIRLKADFNLSRLDFGVSSSSLLLSDSVRVQLNYLIQ